MEKRRWEILGSYQSEAVISVVTARLAEADIPYQIAGQSVHIIPGDPNFGTRILIPAERIHEALQLIKGI